MGEEVKQGRMGLFDRIRNALSLPGDSLSSPSGWLTRLLALSGTSSGLAINEYNALTVADVYKCDRVIRETVAMLPWKIYKTKLRGREEARNHPLYFLLHDEPNDHMTSFTYRELMVSNLNLWGKHFSYIERNKGRAGEGAVANPSGHVPVQGERRQDVVLRAAGERA